MMLPHALGVADAARQIRSRTLSPLTLVEACLARIAQVEPPLEAWVLVDHSGAREAARALEADARAGRIRGTLHGVPVGLKDIFDVAGMTTTSGAATFAHRRPDRDSDAAALLRAAGAIVLGKTATTEFAYADPTQTRNPWNREHTPGGSSSGSAAAVAARMIPAALGSQTIGSTLRPAAYCGIVGLKATHGLISAAGVTPLAWSLDHVGILTRSVEDAALILSVLASQRRDETARPLGGRAPRLGIPRELFGAVATPEVSAHVDEAAAGFAGNGAFIEDVRMPLSAADLYDAGPLVLRVEAAAYHAKAFAAHAESYGPRIRGAVEAGRLVTAVDYVAAQQARHRFQKEVAPVFERFDALLMPVAPAPAPRGLDSTGDPVLCAPWSFAGLPSIALPSGISTDGLPLAIQLIAGASAEERLLDVARWCEARLGFSAQPRL